MGLYYIWYMPSDGICGLLEEDEDEDEEEEEEDDEEDEDEDNGHL